MEGAADGDRGIEATLDRLRDAADRPGKVSVGEIVDALGGRGFGPLLFVPAVIELSPIGGIPGVPTLLAAIVAIFACQIAWGRERMWLPGMLRRLSVSGARMRTATAWLRPAGRRLDRWFHGRLAALVGWQATRVAAVVCVGLCAVTPPLELVPFASTAPMAAIAVFGLAMTLGDGLLMAAGFVLTAAVAGGGLWLALGTP